MFGRIIVATDLHASTRMSLRAACDLLRSDGEVLLVHVIRPMATITEKAVYERMKAAAGAQMRALAAPFTRQRGVEIVCLAAVGSPGREIARIAQERQADLVVLAHDPVADPATLGSVSYRVAHLAPCAVLVLKTPRAVVPARPAARARARPR
jgi:nucleotide-binding universal stress UspA family protein